jgi:hypothetical protein
MKVRSLFVYLVILTALTIGFTTLAAAQSSAARAIYDASAVVPTNLKGIRTFNPPPAGFNPLTATEEENAVYGFPPRPPQEDTEHYARWAKAMTAAGTRWAGELRATPYQSRPARPAPAPEGAPEEEAGIKATGPTTQYYYNWSGFINTQPTVTKYNNNKTSTTNSFYYIDSDFNVPVAEEAFNTTPPGTICDGLVDLVSVWNGIDGDLDGSALLQGGTQSGISCSNPYGFPLISTFYNAWIEWYPAYPEIATFSVNPGDDFFVETWDTTATQGYVWLDDETLGISAVFGITSNGGPGLIGNSAEYVVERPCCIDLGGTTYFYPLANYVQNFWANSYAETFYEYYKGLATPWYPGSTSTNTDLAIMVNDQDSANISIPAAQGKYGIFFEAAACAYSGGCTP